MTVQERIENKGYYIRANMGYKNDEQTIVSYSALKDSRAVATESSKTALLKRL